MILPAAGLPGRFAERCENVLCALAAAGDGALAFLSANSLEEVGASLLAHDTLRAVMVARRPSANLAAALAASGRPFMIALEEPQACVAALSEDHGRGLLDAVRTVAHSGAAMMPLTGLAGALVLKAAQEQDAMDLARRIAAHYRLDVPADGIATAAEVFHRHPSGADLVPPAYIPPAMSASAPFEPGFESLLPELMSAALAPIWRGLSGGSTGEIVWHRDLFFAGEPAGPPAAVMDITGPARCLIYGPYIHLPPGSWSCALMLGCSRQAVGLTLIAEIYAGSVLTRVSFEISEPGFFEIEFSCVLPSADHPLEIRLFNAEAAFEGHLALIQATMKPLKAVRMPARRL